MTISMSSTRTLSTAMPTKSSCRNGRTGSHVNPAQGTAVVSLACWIDLATSRYVVELRHVGTRI